MLDAILSPKARSYQVRKEPQPADTSGTRPDVPSTPATTSRKSPQQERREQRLTDKEFEQELDARGPDAIFEAALFPDGLKCPFCGDNRIEYKNNERPMRYRCRVCREHFSIKSITIMHGSKLDLDTWLRAIYIYTSPRHSTQPLLSIDLAARLGVDEKTASGVIARLNQSAGADMFEAPLQETCEMDVTELGSKRKRRRGEPRGKNHGRIKVIGVKGRASGQVRLRLIARYTKTTVRKFVNRFVGRWVHIHVDAHASNRDIPGVNQHTVNHSHEFVNHADADACTNGIEGEWPVMSRVLAFVLRSSKFVMHLAGYQGRRNLRSLSHRDRIDALIVGMKGQHWCRDWLPPDKRTTGQLPLPFEPVQKICGHCHAMEHRRRKATANRSARQHRAEVRAGRR